MLHEPAADAAQASNPPTVGDVLRHAREARGESLADVAHALKLSQKQIEAIELERFDLLPGPAFVRGFVRNYARYLGIDAEPLAASLRRDAPSQSVRLAPVTNATGAMPQGGGERQILKPALIVVGAMAFALLLGWYFDWFKLADVQRTARNDGPASALPQRMESPPRLAAPPAVAARPDVLANTEPLTTLGVAGGESTAVAALPPDARNDGAARVAPDVAARDDADTSDLTAPSITSEGPVTAETQNAAVAPATEAPATEAPATAATGTQTVVEPQAEAAAAETGAADRLPETVAETPAEARAVASSDMPPRTTPLPGTTAQLVFRMQGESWIQVRDRAGAVVYTGIGAPGTTRTVDGEPPFAIVVGNAGQVSLEYDGQSLDLNAHTRSGGVARMTVP